MLMDLTATLLHHTKKTDIAGLTKILLYSDYEKGDYLAPLAAMQDNMSKELINDYKNVIESGDLPANIQPLTTEQFTSIRKHIRPSKDRAIAELREAIYESKNDKHAKRAQQILKKNFNMDLVQALDFLHMHGLSQNSDQMELAEELIDSTLKYVARDQDPIELMSEDAKEDILSEYLVETFTDRLA